MSRTPPKSPSAAATALSFTVCSPAGRSFGKGIRVNSPLKSKTPPRKREDPGTQQQQQLQQQQQHQQQQHRTPKKSPLQLLGSPPAPPQGGLPTVAVQISPSKNGEKYEILATSPAKTPRKLLKTPQKSPKTLQGPLGGAGAALRQRRRVVLIPVTSRSPLKSELQSSWEARHDINNLDNYSARIRFATLRLELSNGHKFGFCPSSLRFC